MKHLEDLSIKELSLLVSREIGELVDVIGLSIDPFGPFCDGDGFEEEQCVICYTKFGKEGYGIKNYVGFFYWLVESEDLCYDFELDPLNDGEDYLTMNWASVHEKDAMSENDRKNYAN